MPVLTFTITSLIRSLDWRIAEVVVVVTVDYLCFFLFFSFGEESSQSAGGHGLDHVRTSAQQNSKVS